MAFGRSGLLVLAVAASACGDGEPADVVQPGFAVTGTPTALRFRLDSAHSLYADDFDKAASALTELLNDAVAASDSFVEAEALTWLALAEWRRASLDEAHQLAQRSLAAKQRYNLTDSLFRSYNTLGLISWDLGRLGDAAAYFDMAGSEADRLDDPGLLAAAEANRGLIALDLGDFATARAAFGRLEEAGWTLGIPRYVANGLTNLGTLSIAVGDPASAVVKLDSAIALYREHDDPNEQIALAQLYEAYAALGRSADAFAALSAALERSRESGEPDEEARNLEALANHYRSGGDLVRARAWYDSALARYEALGLTVEAGSASRAVAAIFVALDDPDRASLWIVRAIERHREAGDRFELFLDLLMLAELQARLAQPYEPALTEARVIARDSHAPSFDIALALAEARIADRAGDPEKVLEILEPFEHGEISVNMPAARSEIDGLLSRAHAALGSTARALERGRSAVAAAELVREGFGSTLLRASFVTGREALYGHLADLLIAAGAIGEAFDVIDAARGRALLEHIMASAQDAGRPSTTTVARLSEAEEMLRTVRELADRVLESETAYYGVRSVSEEEQLVERLAEARSQYEMLLSQAIEADSSGTSLLGQTTVPMGEIQRVLGEGEVLVEYLVADGKLILVWLTADSAGSVVRRERTDELATKVRVARGLLAGTAASEDALRPVLEALHELLIGPVRQHLGASILRRIVFVPHAFLNYFPFAALSDPRSGRYLVEDVELITLPTASALWALRRGRGGTRAAEHPREAVAFAPLHRALPATQDEVRALARVVERAGIRRGRRATERAFREALTETTIVHAATHAVLNQRNPMFSAIQLARSRGGTAADDGWLELHEVLTMQVNSPLVFLSGCETGVGTAWATRHARGEDYATLAQAFLYAGADNVVATLWRIRDRGAMRITEMFYRAVQDGDPVSALASAQRGAIEHPDLRAPYLWAAYTISGSGQLVSQ